MTLDDSSGATIEITCGRPNPKNGNVTSVLPQDGNKLSSEQGVRAEGLTATGRSVDLEVADIGTVVKVKGGIGSFRGEKQLLLERISILRTTNEEATAWAENTAFRMDVLNTPWFVSEKDRERARRKAEGLERYQEAREKHVRKRKIKLGVQAKPSNKELRRSNAPREVVRHEKANDTTTEKEALKYRKNKRDEEKRLRKQEFDRLKMEQKDVRAGMPDRLIEAQERTQGKPIFMDEEEQMLEGDTLVSRQIESKEQAKIKRAEDRRSRELEFRRLKGSKDVQGADR